MSRALVESRTTTHSARYEPTDQPTAVRPTLEEIQERAYEIYVQRERIDGFDLAGLASGGRRAEQ